MSHDTAEDLAKLVEETERVARQVEDVRCRIAAAKRRPGSPDEAPAEPTATSTEAAHRAHPEQERVQERGPTPPSERIPCLEAVSKLLPPLRPRSSPDESGVYAIPTDPGRYAIISERRERLHHADLPMPVAPKKASA